MSRTQRLLYFIGRNFVRLYTRVMLKMDLRWEGRLPDGPFLIVANHPSTSDPFYLMALFHRPIRIMMIESPFHFPVFGGILRRAGHIPVSLANKRAALDDAIRELARGNPVAIFPEGDTSPRHEGYLPPRSGAARLALSAGVPVVPVGIYLRRQHCWTIRSNASGRPTTGFWYLRGPYGLTIGQAMVFSGDVEDREHVRFISKTIMDAISCLANASQARIEGQA